MRARNRTVATAGVALALLSGCQGATDTNGGLTNGPPPTSARDKAAVRSDVPTGPAPARGEALGAAGDMNNNAGSAGSGGGVAEASKGGVASGSDTVRANPPAKTSTDPGSAAGGTKPAGTIQTGTPRSPQ